MPYIPRRRATAGQTFAIAGCSCDSSVSMCTPGRTTCVRTYLFYVARTTLMMRGQVSRGVSFEGVVLLSG